MVGRSRLRVGDRVDLDPEGLASAGHAGADGRSLHAADDGCDRPSRQFAGLDDLGDHADAGVASFYVRDKYEPASGRARSLDGSTRLVGLERQREDHPGQHDSRGEREERQGLLLV